MDEAKKREQEIKYWEKVLAAIRRHDTKAIQDLLDNGLDINKYRSPFDSNAVGDSLLHYVSADEEATEVLEFLLDHGADVYAKSYRPTGTYMPLSMAQGYRNTLMLLQHGADPNVNVQYIPEQKTALQYYLESGDMKMAKLFIEYGADIYDIALLERTFANKDDTMSNLLIESIFSNPSKWPEDFSLLSYAITSGNKELTEKILRLSLTPDALNNALFSAIEIEDSVLAKRLVGMGARPDDGIVHAASEGNIKKVKMWLRYGADININNAAALHAAVGNGHVQMVDLLLKKGASPDEIPEDHYYSSPLLTAVKKGHLKIVKLLLKQNADPFKKCLEPHPFSYDMDGLEPVEVTPLSIAEKYEEDDPFNGKGIEMLRLIRKAVKRKK